MGKFKDWYEKNLIVSRYILPGEIEKSKFDIIINVSDEYIIQNHQVCMRTNKQYFWFPMTETGSNMGINSLFGALQILWIAESKNQKVLLHCHAGANRSPTVSQAYYYLRTKEHFVESENKKMSNDDLFKMFNITDESEKSSFKLRAKQNRLISNINSGNLPAIYLLEDFLKSAEKKFIAYEIGNLSLDSLKIDSKINNY